MKPNGIITLLTDFGTRDGFTGIMKGVIYGIHPRARIVDITHHVPPQDVQAGSFLIHNSYSHFPDGSIHVVVVDPGVGTDRRILLAATDRHFFLAPDNRVLQYIFRKNETLTVVEVLNKKYFLDTISHTFHGRDIFAPVAAHLSTGIPIEEFGPVITDFDRGEISEPIVSGNEITGTIIHVDTFGNLITNISGELLRKKVTSICAGKHKIERVSHSYAEVAIGEIVAVVGSSGFLEIAIRNGNARETLSLNRGDPVRIKLE